MFRVAPRFETKHLEEIFRHKVFKMLLSKGKIGQHASIMASFWLQRLLWPKDTTWR